ncbi:hypothetical protein SESBI_42314 [Sesbania bispinosa]|nr:hypothetical protein SESBI_42314 [Sesbania bispinosa]
METLVKDEIGMELAKKSPGFLKLAGLLEWRRCDKCEWNRGAKYKIEWENKWVWLENRLAAKKGLGLAGKTSGLPEL